MKLLIVSKCPTHPTTAGNRWGTLAMTELFKQLGVDVHFLYVQEMPMRRSKAPFEEDLQATRAYWGDHFHLFKVSTRDKLRMNLLKLYRRLFCHWHYGVDDNYPYGLARVVNRLDRQYHFDICIVNYTYLTRLFRYIHIPKQAVFTHDCMAYKDLKTGEKTYCITAHTEAVAAQRCKHIFVVQDQEAAYFSLIAPHSIVYNIYGRYTYLPTPPALNHDLLFLSGNNHYNQNGLRWFLADIWPSVRQAFPDARLLIGGGICSVVRGWTLPEGVELQGYVDDLAQFYAQGDITINPTYQGTGLKIKTFEAIAYDKVTMVHPHSMAGVFRAEEAPIFSSTDPQQWVARLQQLWGDPTQVRAIKASNKDYLARMNAFIESEYKRFLQS